MTTPMVNPTTTPLISPTMQQAQQQVNPLKFLELKVESQQKKIETLSFTITDYLMRLRDAETQLAKIKQENKNLTQENQAMKQDISTLLYNAHSCDMCSATIEQLGSNGLKSTCAQQEHSKNKQGAAQK